MSFLENATDPAAGQSLTEIEEYLRSCGEGDKVAIRNTQGGILHYTITEVSGTNPRAGRVYTKASATIGGTSWYMKTGKNTFHPKGQSRLFLVSEAIEAYARKYPNGVLSYAYHTPE